VTASSSSQPETLVGLADRVSAISVSRGHTVDLNAITHRYGAMLAVDNATLPIRAGEIVALLGPSGCGKTTLLRIVAGFVTQSAGQVLIDGRSIDDLTPNLRKIGIVFQNYALFPHLTVRENVAYGLKARGAGKAEIREKVARFLDAVQLGSLADRLPRQLSGGQQQRVALARALAVEPRVLLLDEPFSALDKSLRLDMQIELRRLQRQFGLTAILVTHDQDEAMSVADRIAVMNRGRVEQVDTPVAVYDRPETLFVSGFIGTTNRLTGRVSGAEGGRIAVELEAGATLEVAASRSFSMGERVVVTVRPEQISIHPQSAPGRFPVRRRIALPIGNSLIHELELKNGTAIKLSEPRGAVLADVTGEAWCGLKPGVQPSVFPIDPEQA
jgi:putative spermidine/putrescine transport system ATP-binding protein